MSKLAFDKNTVPCTDIILFIVCVCGLFSEGGWLATQSTLSGTAPEWIDLSSGFFPASMKIQKIWITENELPKRNADIIKNIHLTERFSIALFTDNFTHTILYNTIQR